MWKKVLLGISVLLFLLVCFISVGATGAVNYLANRYLVDYTSITVATQSTSSEPEVEPELDPEPKSAEVLSKEIPLSLVFNTGEFHFNPFNLTITLTDSTLSFQGETIASISELVLDIDGFALFSRELSVEQLLVRGVKFYANYQNEAVNLAGWQPQLVKTQQPVNEVVNEDAATPEQSEEPWTISIQQAQIVDAELGLNALRKHQWQVAEFNLNNAQLAAQSWQADVTLNSEFNAKPLNFDLTVNGEADFNQLAVLELGELSLAFSLADYHQWLPDEYKAVAGTLTIDTAISLKKANQAYEGFQVNAEKLKLTLNEFELPLILPGQDAAEANLFSLASTELEAKNLVLGLTRQFSLQEINSELLLSAYNFSWQQPEKNALVAAFSKLETEGLAFDYQQDGGNTEASFERFALTNIILSQVDKLKSIEQAEGNNVEALATLRTLIAANGKYDKNSEINKLYVQSLTLDSEAMHLYSSAEYGIENIVDLGGANSEGSSDETQPVNVVEAKVGSEVELSDTQPFDFELSEINVIGEPVIVYFDTAPSQPVIHYIKIAQGQLTGISSADELANFNVALALGSRGKIGLEGQFLTKAPTQKLSLGVKMESIDLTPYSPYVRDSINYDIKQGLLFTDIDMEVINDNVDGIVKTNIKAIDIEQPKRTKNENGKASVGNQSSAGSGLISLDLALNQLTDRQGNLSVDIPLKGSIHDPSFGIDGFISILTTKAIQLGAQNYLIQTFLPYANIVTVAMLAGDTLFDINIAPLPYDAGQAKLLEPQLSYGQELAKVLKDKPELQLTICADVSAELQQGQAALTVRERTERELLGKVRIDNFIELLVDEYQIDTGRLIPCKVKVFSESDAIDNLNFELK
ncbi:MAG: hypothetical protein CL811_01085 [Colwelliaceae bacterium]|nr:hypothetical protein [Colwelliaceae bacterium]